MSKYIIEFQKSGTICYTSHLDLMRIFKRGFKRTGIPLAYSQGFNPHPKMGFAQPLSLGYTGLQEYIEFETMEESPGEDGAAFGAAEIMQKLDEGLPEGVDLVQIFCADHLRKTLAAHTRQARYQIRIPCADAETACEMLAEGYLKQDKIEAMKRQKKSKELKAVDIRPMIRDIRFSVSAPEISVPAPRSTEADASSVDRAPADGIPAGDAPADGTTACDAPSADAAFLVIEALLDCGSGSNLSPELVSDTVRRFAGITADRAEIDITREEILFDLPLQELLEGK